MLHPLRKFGKVAGRVAVGLWLGDRVRDIVKPRTSRYDYRPGQAAQLYANFCVWIDQTIGWPKLPTYVGLAVLLGERTKLRQDNLQDTSVFPTLPQPEPQAKGTAYLRERMPDGSFNDLNEPLMGSLGSRFGRNVPLSYTYTEPVDALLDIVG